MKSITASEIEKREKSFFEEKQKGLDAIVESYYAKMIETINQILDKKK